MVPALAPSRPPVQHNQTLDHESLRKEAEAAANTAKADTGLTRTALAEALGVSSGAISRALSEGEDPGRYASLQIRIIEHLTPYTIRDETRPTFRVVRDGRT